MVARLSVHAAWIWRRPKSGLAYEDRGCVRICWGLAALCVVGMSAQHGSDVLPLELQYLALQGSLETPSL